MELTQGAVVADRFRLIKLLGQGAMGMVWSAHHTGLDIPCAVKFIRTEAANSPELRARFEREAKAAAQLRSPHVVQILDHGVWNGLPYMAMEFLEGEELQARLERLGRLEPTAVAEIVQQIARALTKAHGMGLIHRDLKPANIYLTKDGDQEIAKILDFGIVKDASGDNHTRAGSMMGTPYYMSPEQAKSSKSIDHRADLWSLGVVVYRCVTGQLPFTAQSIGDLLMKILSAPLPVPSQVAQVPPGFDAWWSRAVARDPAQRFQSAKELADALTAVVAPPRAEVAAAATTAPQAGGSSGPVSMGGPAGPVSIGGYPSAPAEGYSGPVSMGGRGGPVSMGEQAGPVSMGAYPAPAAAGYAAPGQGGYPGPASTVHPPAPYSTALPAAPAKSNTLRTVLITVAAVLVCLIALGQLLSKSKPPAPTSVPVLGGAAPRPTRSAGKW